MARGDFDATPALAIDAIAVRKIPTGRRTFP